MATAVQFRGARARVAGRVLGEMGEEITEDGFQRGHGERHERCCDFGILDAHHGVVEPAAVGFPLTGCDEPDADRGDDNYAGGGN